MKIEFRRLALENFGSFVEKQTLNLANLEVGVHFICGENHVDKELGSEGAGKSTLANAFSWCLTGRTSNGLKATDVKPWKGGVPKVSVVANFNGKKHVIKRTAPNSIELDGQEVGQEHIDQLLGMSYAVFKQTVLFGQKEPLFFDLPNREKLQLLSDVLELDRWEVRSQKAGERTRELEKKVAEFETLLRIASESLEITKAQLKETEQASTTWVSEQAAKLKTARNERGELLFQQTEIDKHQKTATRIAKAIAERLGEAEANMTIARTHIERINREEAQIVAKAGLLEEQSKAISAELTKLGIADVCPVCEQPIEGTELDKHKKHLRKQRTELLDQIKNLRGPKTTKAYTKHKADFSAARASLVTQQAELDEKRKEIDKYTRQSIELETRLEHLKKSITERKREKNPHLAQIGKLEEHFNKLKVQQTDLTERRDKANRQALRARYWIKGFKDVRLFVLDDLLQELEMTNNSLLEEMGLLDWQVRYAVERETKSGTIQTGMQVSILSPRNNKEVKWEVWSGGESQRLRLAGSLALSEVLLNYANIEINLEILDEPTKHLGEPGVRALGEMLAARSEQLQRKILYIDHQAVEGSQFASTITVCKTKEGSFIVDS